MERIFETLPQAKKWSLILSIIVVISLFFQIIGVFASIGMNKFNFGDVISIIFQGFLVFFLFAYWRACKAGIEDESEESLETACRQQKNIFIMYGIQSAMLLIIFFITAISLVLIAINR